jgi:predicted nucleic acid-binding protein
MAGREAFEIMKVFLDTNIVLDALMERIPWVDEASIIVQAIQSGQIAAYISASSLTDIAYLSYRISKDRNLCILGLKLMSLTLEHLSDGSS